MVKMLEMLLECECINFNRKTDDTLHLLTHIQMSVCRWFESCCPVHKLYIIYGNWITLGLHQFRFELVALEMFSPWSGGYCQSMITGHTDQVWNLVRIEINWKYVLFR